MPALADARHGRCSAKLRVEQNRRSSAMCRDPRRNPLGAVRRSLTSGWRARRRRGVIAIPLVGSEHEFVNAHLAWLRRPRGAPTQGIEAGRPRPACSRGSVYESPTAALWRWMRPIPNESEAIALLFQCSSTCLLFGVYPEAWVSECALKSICLSLGDALGLQCGVP